LKTSKGPIFGSKLAVPSDDGRQDVVDACIGGIKRVSRTLPCPFFGADRGRSLSDRINILRPFR
jgi:hypothetical protein